MPDVATPEKAAADLQRQAHSIETLKSNGWIVVDDKPLLAEDGTLPATPAELADAATRKSMGQVLMQLNTGKDASGKDTYTHILVMRDGERVDSSQRLGKQPAKPTEGEP